MAGKKKEKLNLQQQKFVAAYIEGGCCNATQAAREAGYKNPQMQGSRMLNHNPDVMAEVERYTKKAEAEIERRAITTVVERHERLATIMRTGSDSDVIRAIDIINKMQATYVQRMEIQAQIKLSPEQAEDRAVSVYRANPELWDRIKRRVENG